MAQKQLNLSPEAIMALIEALSVRNVASAGDATTSPSASAVSSNNANGSASSAVPAANAATLPATQQATARAHPLGVSTPSALSSARPSSPFILRSPFTGLPHDIQPVASSSAVTASAEFPTLPPAQVHSGFHCSNCGAFNLAVGQTGETFYVVTAGRQVGVFTNWEIVQPLISGVCHACHKKYRTAAEAQEAFKTALAEGKVHVL